MESSSTEPAKVRWYHLTPAKYLAALLLLVAFLVLSERFKWFLFNRRLGWTALMAVEYVGGGLLLLLVGIGIARLFGRKTQFGLRTVLLAILVAAIPLGWLAIEIQRARTQASMAKRFQQRESYPGWLNTYILPARYEWLQSHVLGRDYFEPVAVLTIRNHNHADFKELWAFPNLQYVKIEGLRLAGSDWKSFHATCPNLTGLTLENCQLDDADASSLSAFTKLDDLSLSGTAITTTWWEQIVALPKLKRLIVKKVSISETMLEQLAQANPNCEVIQEQP